MRRNYFQGRNYGRYRNYRLSNSRGGFSRLDYQQRKHEPQITAPMPMAEPISDKIEIADVPLEDSKSETCAQTEASVEIGTIDTKVGQLTQELDKNKQAAHTFVVLIVCINQ